MKKTLLLVGAGKGLGNHIAQRFGREDFRVILISRNEGTLKEYQREFVKEKIEAHVLVADTAKPETLTKAFSSVQSEFGAPDVLVYNVGVTDLDAEHTINSELLMQRYQMDVASAYHCAQLLNTEAFSKKKGAIIFTGGGLALRPEATFTPLSMDKAALRAMVYLLHDEYSEKGIFIGTVTVCGGVKADTYFAPELIAEKYWELYTERSQCEIVYKEA